MLGTIILFTNNCVRHKDISPYFIAKETENRNLQQKPPKKQKTTKLGDLSFISELATNWLSDSL